jgi:hypothetical protein
VTLRNRVNPGLPAVRNDNCGTDFARSDQKRLRVLVGPRSLKSNISAASRSVTTTGFGLRVFGTSPVPAVSFPPLGGTNYCGRTCSTGEVL